MNKQNQPLYIDLHTHTNYSDGIYLTPKQLVIAAKWSGMDILAKTDHDSICGYDAAKKTAEQIGIVLIPGVELTTQNYHLLALNFNPRNADMVQFIEHSKKLQDRRVQMRIEKLQKDGVPIKFEDVYRDFPESRLGKVNLFNTMVTNDACRKYLGEKHPGWTFNELWKHYVGHGGIATLEVTPGVEIEEAVYHTINAGGIIGIAHPCKDVRDASELEALLERGLQFVESQPNLNAKNPKNKMFEDYAVKRGIPVSYGSDYHGVTMVHRRLLGRGENVLSEEMRELLNRGYVKVAA